VVQNKESSTIAKDIQRRIQTLCFLSLQGDIEDPEIFENKIAPVIGTINPSYFANPVILPSRIRKEEMSLQDTK
jgi:hypothetical protein